MNDATVRKLWEAFQSLERRVLAIETRLYRLDGQIRARLKEEAEDRELQDQEAAKARWEIEHDL